MSGQRYRATTLLAEATYSDESSSKKESSPSPRGSSAKFLFGDSVLETVTYDSPEDRERAFFFATLLLFGIRRRELAERSVPDGAVRIQVGARHHDG